jgi:hypothetical protein
MPRSRDARREKEREKKLPTPAMRSIYGAPFLLRCTNIAPWAILRTACKREDALNSAVVTCDADMPCPDTDVPSGSRFQELHISAAQGSKLLHCAAAAAIGHWRQDEQTEEPRGR